jgi:hypothetical protein
MRRVGEIGLDVRRATALGPGTDDGGVVDWRHGGTVGLAPAEQARVARPD